MDTLLFSLALLALCASTKANDDRESYSHYIPNSTVSSDINEDSFPHVTVSVGSVALVLLVGIFIYYFCCRNKGLGEGFMQFTNPNDGEQPRRNNRWRWRNRRGNRRQNYMNNSQEARHSTHVIIQPVVNMALPSLDQNSSASRQDDFSAAGNGNFNDAPVAPPTYDDTMNNVMQNNLNNTTKTASFSYFNRY